MLIVKKFMKESGAMVYRMVMSMSLEKISINSLQAGYRELIAN